jgi:hypothetical protein
VISLSTLMGLSQLGCAPPAARSSVTQTPNGGHGYLLECVSTQPGDCYAEGTRRCANGYTFVSQYGAGAWLRMVVECKQ